MKTLFETIMSQLVALIVALSGLALALAQLLKARKAVLESAEKAAALKPKRVTHEAEAPATTPDQTAPSAGQNRRLWQMPRFWLLVLDLLLGIGAFTLLFRWSEADNPATLGHVAICAMLASVWIVSVLRRW